MAENIPTLVGDYEQDFEQLKLFYEDIVLQPTTKISSTDGIGGYLEDKLIAGTGITLTVNSSGENETITVAASGTALTDKSVEVSSNDTTPGNLLAKLTASDAFLAYAEVGDGGDEDLDITFDETQIDHANIQSNGTNTHAAIDTHIADSTIHFTAASLNLDTTYLKLDASNDPVTGDLQLSQDLIVDVALRVGASASATAAGDFSAGVLALGSELFFDQSAASLRMRSNLGATSVFISGTAGTTTVFNEVGADINFRVEGSGETNALFVQGSDGFVGIGTGTPSVELDVVGEINNTTDIKLVTTTGNTADIGADAAASANTLFMDIADTLPAGANGATEFMTINGKIRSTTSFAKHSGLTVNGILDHQSNASVPFMTAIVALAQSDSANSNNSSLRAISGQCEATSNAVNLGAVITFLAEPPIFTGATPATSTGMNISNHAAATMTTGTASDLATQAGATNNTGQDYNANNFIMDEMTVPSALNLNQLSFGTFDDATITHFQYKTIAGLATNLAKAWASVTLDSDATASAAEYNPFDEDNHAAFSSTANTTARDVVFTQADGRFTCTCAGVYRLTIPLIMSISSSAAVKVKLKRSGTTFYDHNVQVHSSVDPVERTFSVIKDCTAGQYFEITVDSQSASTLQILDGSTFNVERVN